MSAIWNVDRVKVVARWRSPMPGGPDGVNRPVTLKALLFVVVSVQKHGFGILVTLNPRRE
jgi:hypothetical protein